jgi:hypothetical protein
MLITEQLQYTVLHLQMILTDKNEDIYIVNPLASLINFAELLYYNLKLKESRKIFNNST